MKRKYDLSATEREICEILWEHMDGMRQAQLLQICNEKGKSWKRQTLNTYLIYLEQKDIIKREHGVIIPLCTEEEYNIMQMQEAVDTMYNGKFGNLFAAFAGSNRIKKEEVSYLQEVLDSLKKGE